jgi:1-acyl-sn-glycerol-3-phosphate acyltransferase
VPDAPEHYEPRSPDRLSVRVLLAANYFFTRVYHHLKVSGECVLPRQGPAILVCNHVSGLDPLLVQSAVRNRLVTWMMAKEYYDLKSLRWMYRAVGAIPVQRSGRDLTATRGALRALEAGHILGVFPEGKIETSRDLLPFQTGVALLAIKSQVPVVPAYLDGTQRGREMIAAVSIPTRATLRFGPAVEFDRTSTARDALDAATEKIRDAVNHLKSLTEHAYNA